MPARRARSLHFGQSWKNGEKNIVFHREHVSKRNRSQTPSLGMQPLKSRGSKKNNQWRSSNYGGYKSKELKTIR